MGTSADKLAYLRQTKADIKDAIIAKGVQVSSSDTFRSYATKIGDISTGGDLEEKTISITENGQTIVTPSSQQGHTYDGMSKVTINTSVQHEFAYSHKDAPNNDGTGTMTLTLPANITSAYLVVSTLTANNMSVVVKVNGTTVNQKTSWGHTNTTFTTNIGATRLYEITGTSSADTITVTTTSSYGGQWAEALLIY